MLVRSSPTRALLTVLLIAGNPATLSAQASFRAEVVARIPVGASPDQISDEACTDGDEGCSAGFAFLDDEGVLYLYDYGHENIKVLRGLGTGNLSVGILSGVDVQFRVDQPTDGAVAGDHTIYVLSDRGSTTDRFQLHALRPGAQTWTSGPRFDVPSVGRMAVGRKVVPVLNAARLGQVDSGGVALFASDLRRDGGVLVARRSGPLSPGAFLPRQPGLELPSGVRITQEGRRTRVQGGSQPSTDFHLDGEFLGADGDGNLYQVGLRPGPPFYLEKYSPGGRLVAQMLLPPRPGWKTLAGKGGRLVCRDGTILALVVTQTECVITRWSVDND